MSKADIERIEDINDWYDNTKEWLEIFASELQTFARIGNTANSFIPSDLLFLTPDEIDSSLNNKLDKLSTVSALQFFTSFEGTLRFDTKNRIRKARVGKDLKKLIKKKNLKDIDMADIINCWCGYYSIKIETFSILKGLFNYRNWLAHGRYWDNVHLPVKRGAITPDYIYNKMRECFDEFKRNEADFEW